MALTRAKLEELIAAGEIEVGGGGFNPNLLHNADFRNPVNQRGVSETFTSGVGGYSIDRWKTWGSISMLPGYIALRENSSIQQRIEGTLLAGAQITITVEANTGTSITTLTVPPTAGTRVDLPLQYFDKVACIHDGSSNFIAIHVYTADYIRNIFRIKVELGPVSTLHLDPPMDHAVELSKCQRFGLPVKGRFSGGQNGTSAWLFVPTPVEMRIVPTYIGPGSVNYYAGSGSTLYTASITDIREKSASGILVMMAAETSLSRVPITNTSVSFEFFASSDL